MESIVSNQPPVFFQADREYDQSQNGWIEPRIRVVDCLVLRYEAENLSDRLAVVFQE